MRNLIAGLGFTAALVVGSTAWADNFVVALPDDYPGERTEMETLISRASLATKPGDSLSVYNATERKRLASIVVPEETGYNNLRLKQNAFGGELRKLAPFLESLDKPAPLSANIFFPQFLREFANTTLPGLPDKSAELLVVGSAKYHDDREPRYTMLEGHFPSDGFLATDDTASPYGASNRRGSLAGVNVHFCTTDDDWIDDVHRQRVERFWSLYVRELGGKLATFTNDLNVCTQRFVEKVTATPEEFAVDPAQTKPEMLRIVRSTEREQQSGPAVERNEGAAFMGNDATISSQPPEEQSGPAKIGIRWACGACDIDLYARASQQAAFLYFANQVTPEGRHNKDWRNSPDVENQYEYIDFTTPVDINNLEIYLHFYRGRQEGGAGGVVRLWFNGKVYEQPFHIAAARGDRQARKRPDQIALGDEWVKVNVAELAGLQPPAAGSG